MSACPVRYPCVLPSCSPQYFDLHKRIYDWFDIQFDYFGRTSCENPATDTTWPQTQITQGIYRDLDEAGLLQEQSLDQGEAQKVSARRCVVFCSAVHMNELVHADAQCIVGAATSFWRTASSRECAPCVAPTGRAVISATCAASC